jgi:hypothetical protein
MKKISTLAKTGGSENELPSISTLRDVMRNNIKH